MSLISGSYSRTCGGGGAPDCSGDIVENFANEGRRGEAPNFALLAGATTGARIVDNLRDLVATRTLRLIEDIAFFANKAS
jgi:hypothetical protein